MTVNDMISYLAKYDISAERKSIYNDIECLRQFGLDIVSVKTSSYGYFVASREFELPELKLLVDSVQASKFVTHKKSLELISKLERLTSRYNAQQLQRQVFVADRAKTFNEKIYYNIDKIQEAISNNKCIEFNYFDLNVNKEKVYRKGGDKYFETPVSLMWNDENYYLVTYKEKYNSYTHYRVDRMENIILSDSPRDLPLEKFDPASYSKKMFSMYSGEETEVDVIFSNELAGTVIEKFGADIFMYQINENQFKAKLKVSVSPFFLSWILGLGNKAKIISPQPVVERMIEFLKTGFEIYN
jgi:predicted DNA-binding transcriptional regulator YafY